MLQKPSSQESGDALWQSPAPELSLMKRRAAIPVMPALPLALLALLIATAAAAPLLTPHDPVRSNLTAALLPPIWVGGSSNEHILGTDGFGRDVLARLLYGARVSLGVAALSILIGTIIGTTVGLLAGYAGGWVDSILMRLVEILLSLPLLLVALALAVAVGPSFTNLVLVLGLLIWTRIARIIRGDTLVVKQQDFVRYAQAVGVPGWLIVARHVLPNVLPSLLVAITLEIGFVILVEASLSFLGGGIPRPQPSWGVMISDGRALISTGWWVALFPGVAIVIAVTGFNMLGDWLRDRLDPKLRES